jgi:hypothetical protein
MRLDAGAEPRPCGRQTELVDEFPGQLRRLLDAVEAGGIEVHLRAAELEPLVTRLERVANRCRSVSTLPDTGEPWPSQASPQAVIRTRRRRSKELVTGSEELSEEVHARADGRRLRALVGLPDDGVGVGGAPGEALRERRLGTRGL